MISKTMFIVCVCEFMTSMIKIKDKLSRIDCFFFISVFLCVSASYRTMHQSYTNTKYADKYKQEWKYEFFYYLATKHYKLRRMQKKRI